MISIVIPCYNSEKSIGELVDGLQKLPGQINEDIEIILVNDRSKDNTFEVIEGLADKYSNIKAIDMMFNVGQFMAIMCGFEHCNGEYIITMDDDLQHPPEEIPKLINAIREDASCTAIIASFDNKKHNIFRNFGSWLVHQIDVKVFSKPKDLVFTGFRIIHKEVVEALTEHKTLYPLIGPLLLKCGKNVKNVQVKHDPRKYGQSTYSIFRLVQTTLNHVINFSTYPLKIISVIGIIVFSISMVLSVIYVLRYFLGFITVQGWITNILLINIFGGLILFSLGIIGQYLIRIMYEVKKFPRFKVRKIYPEQKN